MDKERNMDRRNALKMFGAILIAPVAIAKGVEPVAQGGYSGLDPDNQEVADAIRSGKLKSKLKLKTIDDVLAWFKHCNGWHISSMDDAKALRIGWAFFKKEEDSYGWNPDILAVDFIKSSELKSKEFGNKIQKCLISDEGRFELIELLKNMSKKA